MKKITLISILAIAAAAATFQSCSKVAALLQYDIPLQSGSVTITIPASSDTTAAISGMATNSINVDSVIKANTKNALGVSNITSVKITSATMTLQNGDDSTNFANFKSCNASIYSNTNTTPYTLSIANNPDVMATTLSLPVDANAELKSYLTGTTFTYTTGGSLRRATSHSLTCVVAFQFNIHVQGN